MLTTNYRGVLWFPADSPWQNPGALSARCLIVLAAAGLKGAQGGELEPPAVGLPMVAWRLRCYGLLWWMYQLLVIC